MRRLLLSDIHSNTEAFKACLERAHSAGFDEVLCCGDIVGYGPEPNETVASLRSLAAVTIRGNHDRVACGQDEPSDFNPHAKAASYWTRSALTPESRDYLRALPVGPLAVGDEAHLVHGAITDEDDYIINEAQAADNFNRTEAAITFFGHTHFQCAFSRNRAGVVSAERPVNQQDFSVLRLHAHKRYLINPGSVGQPRDGDPRSAFAIWDATQSRLEFHRVEYEFSATQEKMRAAGLPTYLIERLAAGR